MRREDYLPGDLLPRPANWYGAAPEPDFKECRNDPDKVWVLGSGGYILYDKREEDRGTDMSNTCICEKEVRYCFPIGSDVNVRGIIVVNGISCARFEELKREIETILESKSLKDGLLVLHEVPEVLYIPIRGANDQANS